MSCETPLTILSGYPLQPRKTAFLSPQNPNEFSAKLWQATAMGGVAPLRVLFVPLGKPHNFEPIAQFRHLTLATKDSCELGPSFCRYRDARGVSLPESTSCILAAQ